ncbi:MAG: PilZ domain-containing protein [Nitrospinae bacterium]|nr:PilZ domain-containing protein [Nitrospinota bacterium]
MFWKKKHDNEPIFTYESCNYRSSLRYYPKENEPLVLEINNVKANVSDIGAGGLSFKCGRYKVGDVLNGKVELNVKSYLIEPELKVLRVSEDGFAHCIYTKISEKETEMIHQFILIKQKEELREKKAKEFPRLNKET